MKKIDRLLIKAQEVAQRKAERFTVGFVTYLPEAGIWQALGNLTSEKAGKGRQIVTEHDDKETAISALEVLSQKYPNAVEDSVIFVEDFEE